LDNSEFLSIDRGGCRLSKIQVNLRIIWENTVAVVAGVMLPMRRADLLRAVIEPRVVEGVAEELWQGRLWVAVVTFRS